MSVVHVVSNLNYAINMGLCVWLCYYEGNNEPAQARFYWDNVGDVWFTVAIFPWYDNDNQYRMGGICSSRFYEYVAAAKWGAGEIAKHGETRFGHLHIIGKNLTYEEAEDRLINLAYWGDGFKVGGQTITLNGGPKWSGDKKVIDISDDFEKLSIHMENTNDYYLKSQIEKNMV